MRTHRSAKLFRAAAGGLVGLAVLAAAVVSTSIPAMAQVKDWTKIKYPELRKFDIPEPERYVMPNGMTVMLMEDHELPLIEVFVRVRTGSRLEPADKAGLASTTGSVMRTGGAGSRTGDEIDDFLDGRGAKIETGIGTSSGSASLSCLKGDFSEVVRVLSDILRSPKFDQKKIDVAKNQAKAAISRRNDDPWEIMFREGERLVYGADSPYSRMAEYATVDSISREDLKAFHSMYFIPNRTYLGVLGDFDSGEMKGLLEGVFGDWKKGPDSKDPEPGFQTASKGGIYHVLKEDMTQSNIYMGHLGIEKDDPDYFVSRVMNQVLSGAYFSRLFNNIRTEKGLAYTVRGSLGANYDYPGTFAFYMSTKTETTAASIDALLEEVDALVGAPPTEEEMKRAKEGLLNSFIFNYDTKGEILNQQLTLAYYGYPSDFLARFQKNIDKVTAEEIHRLAKKRVSRDNLAILVVGKSEGLDRPLASFGEVTELDVTIPEPGASETAIAAAPGMSMEQAVSRGAQVMDGVLAASGGAGNVDAVKSVRTEAGVSVVTPQGEFQLSLTRVLAIPDRVRIEMNTPVGKQIQVFTPSGAFVETPGGVQSLGDEGKAEGLRSLRRDLIPLLQARQDPDRKVIFTGTETIDGMECDTIAVMLEDDNIRLAVDSATGKIVTITYQGKSMAGVPGEISVRYDDYRTVEGVSLPFRARHMFNGEPMISYDIKEVVINGVIDEASFRMPSTDAEGGTSGGR